MSRIKINIPVDFHFSVHIAVRTTDLNYGGHVGNDKILTLIHEARICYLNSFGYSEMNIEGVALIMSDVAIEFKSELFATDKLIIHITVAEFSRVGFNLYYKLVKNDTAIVAIAKTGMVAFDYLQKKVVSIPVNILSVFR